MYKRNLFITLFLLVVLSLGSFLVMGDVLHRETSENEDITVKRQFFIKYKRDIISDLIAKGNYSCCLREVCSYCIEKTPQHGVGANCECLKDVVEGRHPCGECMGEILEGHGNPYLAKFFPMALADELGDDHLAELKSIISDKYDLVQPGQVNGDNNKKKDNCGSKPAASEQPVCGSLK